MKPAYVMSLIIAVLLPEPVHSLVFEDDFKVKKSADLIKLCTASPEDPHYREAIHFCHGYLVGAFHYYLAQETGPNGSKFLCIPEPKPSRNETIDRFVIWAKGHPEYNDELPVETEFRFLTESWPCE